MEFKNKIIKTAVMSGVVAPMSLSPIISQAEDWDVVDSKSSLYSDKERTFDISYLIDRTNMDKGVVETKLTAKEAALSPLTTITKGQPIIMGMYDGANEMGTIQVATMKRHPDGSATLIQRFFTPHDFDRKSDGGELSDQEYSIIQDRYGGNPFADFKTNDSTYRHTFIELTPAALQTAMGIAMQRYGSSYGLFAYLEPQVRVWTTTSGNAFRKKVTTHVEAHFKPHWYVMTPSDIGSSYGGVGKPFYVLSNRKVVISGATLHEVEENRSNIDSDRVWVFYDKKSKSGWTGLTMVLVGPAISVLSGNISSALPGITDGSVSNYSFIDNFGNLDEVVSEDLDDYNGLGDTESLAYEGSWSMKWKNKMRDRVTEGPNSESKQLGSINREFESELDDWDEMVRPE